MTSHYELYMSIAHEIFVNSVKEHSQELLEMSFNEGPRYLENEEQISAKLDDRLNRLAVVAEKSARAFYENVIKEH